MRGIWLLTCDDIDCIPIREPFHLQQSGTNMKALKDLAGEDAILKRINKSDLEVASIEFGRRQHSFPVPSGFVELGKQECDPLVIQEETREVVLLNHEVEGRILKHAAKNIEALIDALCIIEKHFEECERNEDLYDDETFMERSSAEAASLAGGEKYVDFYRSIFGI